MPGSHPGFLVYQEDYLGELAYPTQPEIDEIDAGGLWGDGLPRPQPGPFLTGGSALAAIDPLTNDSEATRFMSNTHGVESVHVQGHFTTFTTDAVASAAIGVSAEYETATPDPCRWVTGVPWNEGWKTPEISRGAA
jgi:hypothetical protein